MMWTANYAGPQYGFQTYMKAPMMADILSRVTPKPATARVEGVVLAVQYNLGEIAGEHQVVFVDRGTKDGIERGNRLQVVQKGDPLRAAAFAHRWPSR